MNWVGFQGRKGKIFFIIFAAFLFSVLSFAPIWSMGAWAYDTRTGTAYTTDGSNTNRIENTVNDITNEIAPAVTTEDLVNRIESKGNEVVTILQKIGKYVCFCSFVICCALALIGCIGNRRLIAGGLIGCVLSGLAYAGIICGREIVNWIAAWAIS